MINNRSHRRRALTRPGKEENGAAPSVLDILASHLPDWIARSAIRRATRGAREIVRWTVLRLVLGWIGAAVATGGILLLLGAGVKGLEALHCPQWLAWLLPGVFAILVALAAMKTILWPREVADD